MVLVLFIVDKEREFTRCTPHESIPAHCDLLRVEPTGNVCSRATGETLAVLIITSLLFQVKRRLVPASFKYEDLLLLFWTVGRTNEAI